MRLASVNGQKRPRIEWGWFFGRRHSRYRDSVIDLAGCGWHRKNKSVTGSEKKRARQREDIPEGGRKEGRREGKNNDISRRISSGGCGQLFANELTSERRFPGKVTNGDALHFGVR